MLALAKGTMNPYRDQMNKVLEIVNDYTTCDVLADAFAVTRTESCKPIFDAGFCLGVEVKFHPASAAGSVVHWNSYNDLMPDMENVASLACDHAKSCSADVAAFAESCFSSQNSEEELMEMAKALAGHYETNYAAKVAEFEPENALMKQLMDMVMNKFTDFESVIAFAEEHATEERKADAVAKGVALLGIASDFCTKGCVSETADFVTAITSKMAANGNCQDASAFCGPKHNGCKRAAKMYIKSRAGIPCCLYGTIEKVIAQAELLIESYGAEAEAAVDAVYASLDSDAKALFDQYKAAALKQWECVTGTWASTKEAQDAALCA